MDINEANQTLLPDSLVYPSRQVFYRTHLLYVPYMILLILHGPNFWKWAIVPGVIYLMERIMRFLRSRTGQGRTFISSGILLPSKVTHLVRALVRI